MYEYILPTLTAALCASVLLPPTESRHTWSPSSGQRTDTPLRRQTTRPEVRAPLRTTTRRVFTTCAGDPWYCNDGSCIDRSQRCDGYRNCPEGSDEFNCNLWEKRVCSYQWGECMPVGDCHGKMIGISDVPECSVKQIERRCYIKCDRHRTTTKAPTSATSLSTSSTPTLLRSVHPFGDATPTSRVCRAEQWTCGDGSCIDMSHRCDRRQYHCPDGSDEFNCDQPPIRSWTTRSQTQLSSESVYLPCSANEWRCTDGACIPLSQRCDRLRYHCSDGSDEFNC